MREIVSKKRILVVEDFKDICLFFRRVLEEDGYEVQTADDGRQGLDIFATFNPDLVIADIYMPVMNGDEMIHRIRQTNSQVKIIFMPLGIGGEYTKNIAADRFMVKPITMDVLRDLVDEVLQ